MKRRKQKDVYECELIRFPDPVEGGTSVFSGGPAHNKRGWLSHIIDSLKDVRQSSDYDDFYLISKEEVTEQIQSAERFVSDIEAYLLKQYSHP